MVLFTTEEKRCTKCKQILPVINFYPDKYIGRRSWCKQCELQYKKQHHAAIQKRHLDYCHRVGINAPMSENRDCPVYLGVYVAERALSKFFDNITRMPIGNPGYDFVCGKGYKIDVKCGALRADRGERTRWGFDIRHNQIADYFLCLAFDNRKDLTPMHVWLIPGEMIAEKGAIGIANCTKSLKKWAKYEHPLDKVNMCCKEMHDSSEPIEVTEGCQ